MKLQWYPGHMTKARRAMQEDIRLVDLCIEILDARVPYASRNPDIDRIAENKFRLVLLNKADLADPSVTESWVRFFESRGISAVALDSRNNNGMKQVRQKIAEVCREKTERDRKRGIQNRPVRAMVAGIPNVGKSTFINSFAGRSAAKTGNKPGVTRGNQWIRLDKNTELLDTPGILWPRFEDETVGTHLAFIGAINDDVVETTELCFELVRFLGTVQPDAMNSRYGMEFTGEYEGTTDQINERIASAAVRKGCLKKGGEPDIERISGIIIDDFRMGKLGKITVERPKDE